MGGNNYPAAYPKQFPHDPYMIPQQPIDESMYREQAPQMSRNDWNQVQQQQQQQQPAPQPIAPKQLENVWPEKLGKHTPVNGGEKPSRKKGHNRDSDYSEEYAEAEENQVEGDESTTTEAPKKVNLIKENLQSPRSI